MEPLPSGPPASTSPTGRLVDAARRAAAPLFAVLGALWLVEAVDSVVLDDRLQANGIRPRDVDGLVGIVAAPFLHGSWGHLIANSVPFVVLGGLVLLRGRALWTGVTVFVMLAGGALTWLVGRSANHIGASGVVFGYLGFLVAAAVLERSGRAVLGGVVAVLLYGGMIWGVLPRGTVSWEGHLFGLLAGVGAAVMLARARRRPAPG